MFICHNCQKPVGPKVSPVRVVESTRAMTYTRKDAEGIPVTSSGSEIVREINLCRSCVGEPEPRQLQAAAPFDKKETFQAIRRHVNGSGNKKGCQESPFECRICRGFMKIFADMPLGTLSEALA